ncbi:glutathione S-transferase N-terminal domain protein [Calothrix sp. NIES-2100]|uniref:glutathione S-transferase family protein n=1 Tax=Calothrix sp. NIES-2100 TaxID=1954172 RepID=UPI000B5E272F|nr:glutathione S-transferase N-terminal domain protein [Calothrix sp. NIES-2100]
MFQTSLCKTFLAASAIALISQPILPLLASPPQQSNSQPAASSPNTPNQAKLKLYGSPKTRTPMVQWYLAELNIPYEYISLNISANEQHQPEFLAINPLGKVPAIVDGDLKLWESGAILLYLADKYHQLPNSLEERAKITQWVIFANATLAPGLFLADKREKEMPILLTPLNQILQQQPFIVSNKLSVADIAVASYLYYAKSLLSLDFSKYPAIVAYLDRVAARSAFKDTLGKR